MLRTGGVAKPGAAWSMYYGSVEDMVGNKACSSSSASKEGGAWASIEFVSNVVVKPTKYTLAHCTAYDGFYLRHWVFEGSSDGEQWTLLRKHSNDLTLNKRGQTHTWDTPNVDAYFSRFRVRMTGKNSYDTWRSYAHALEIYGFVRGEVG